MKILFITRRFYPDVGGVEKHVYELSKELTRRGHKLTIITESPATLKLSGASDYHLKHQTDIYAINSKEPLKSIQTVNSELNQVSILRFNFGKDGFLKKFRIWIELSTILRVIKNSDIVHCHDVFFWYLPFRFLFPTKKVFTTFHGYETKFPPALKSKIIRKISEKLSFGNICVGDYIKKWYGTKPDYVTYGGIEKVQSSKFKVQGLIKRRGPIRILLVGRLEEDNGAKIYLEALRDLRKKGISYSLVVCGEGAYEERFKRLGKLTGFVVDLNKYIDRADFIFASSYLSIFEGLIRAKNVFSVFQNELKKDYLKLSPFARHISISGDHKSLVNNILHMRNTNNKSYNFTISGQKWAKTQTWSKVADIYLKLWNK
jgi:glycosyltransferase involved in cell wall biosynthesis